jgi:hypothetical protein
LLEKLGHLALDAAPGRDILDAQKDQGVGAALPDHLTSVQQHGALADTGKIVLDLIGLDDGVPGQNLLEQRPQFRTIPLTVAQRVNRTALNILPAHLESHVIGTACDNHAEFIVEDQQRLRKGIHDGLGQRSPVHVSRQHRTHCNNSNRAVTLLLLPLRICRKALAFGGLRCVFGPLDGSKVGRKVHVSANEFAIGTLTLRLNIRKVQRRPQASPAISPYGAYGDYT